jgi:putative tryptophan/tyrosine transport system substrate-binding protein
VVARAQQAAMPVVGYLDARSAALSAGDSAAFRRGLAEAGYVEGSSVAIEARFADGQLDRLPILAAELVRRQVAVIFTVGSDAAQAAKHATTPIAIVFSIGNDPVQTGLVASLNRPGGNITGVTGISREIQGKRLAITRDLLSNTPLIATFSNPVSVVSDINLRDLEAAAASIGQRLLVLSVRLKTCGVIGIICVKRWIVERTIAWLNRCRRLAKDWENLNCSGLAFLKLASIRLMLRKLCNP